IVAHIDKDELDNRDCNLKQLFPFNKLEKNDKLPKINRIQKDITPGGFSYNKQKKRWEFRWYEKNIHRAKIFRTKDEVINYKSKHDKLIKDRNPTNE
ncbi:16184_t:CDS:1, partial [Cetraspora pellucida]